MGLLPQLRPSAFKVVAQRSQYEHQPLSKRSSLDLLHSSNQRAKDAQLSTDAQQLKSLILAAHAADATFVRFSFRRMRHKVTPPVEIPENVAHARASAAFVAGKKVPFTRVMHANAQKRFVKRRLDMIHEYVEY